MNLEMEYGVGYDPYASACMPPLSYESTMVLSIVGSVLGILWTGYNLLMLRRIDLAEAHEEQGEEGLIQDMPLEQRTLLLEFGYKLYDACIQFCKYQYLGCLGVAVVAFLLLWFVSDLGPSAAVAFLVGAFVNILAGAVSFALSTRSSCRVAYCARYGLAPTFRTNYQAASVIAFSTTSLNLLVLTVTVQLYKQHFQLSNSGADPKYFVKLFQAVAGYGLGASFTALFARLGGGIFEAATEAGSQLIGKVEGSLAFNNSRNAATVGKHAGLNVGGVTGAQSDQLGSYCELTCVAFLLSSSSVVGYQGENTACAVSLSALSLPLVVLSVGMMVSVATSVLGVVLSWVQTELQLLKTIRLQRLIPLLLMAALLYLCLFLSLPTSFKLLGLSATYRELHAPWEGYLCGLIGLLSSLALFLCAEVTISKNMPFVGILADKCRAGAAASITLGLAFGYFSSFVPTLFFCLSAYFSYNLLGFYGVSLCALAMLSTTPIHSALQSTAALASNALTAAKIANLNDEEKQILQQLAQNGQNSMAINRATSLGCTALVGMTLFGGFLSNAHLDTLQAQSGISLTDPLIFTGLLVGGIFPFVLAGLTVKAARKAVSPFKQEVERQLREDEGIARGDSDADYAGSVKPLALKTVASLLGPVLLVLVAPFVFGLAIGPKIVAGILLGMVVSGLEFSSSASNSADAWRCAKKVIESGGVTDEQGRVQGVDSEAYRGAAMGAEVGLSLGKCGGGSMGASIKVMGMLAVLFGGEFAALHGA